MMPIEPLDCRLPQISDPPYLRCDCVLDAVGEVGDPPRWIKYVEPYCTGNLRVWKEPEPSEHNGHARLYLRRLTLSGESWDSPVRAHPFKEGSRLRFRDPYCQYLDDDNETLHRIAQGQFYKTKPVARETVSADFTPTESVFAGAQYEFLENRWIGSRIRFISGPNRNEERVIIDNDWNWVHVSPAFPFVPQAGDRYVFLRSNRRVVQGRTIHRTRVTGGNFHRFDPDPIGRLNTLGEWFDVSTPHSQYGDKVVQAYAGHTWTFEKDNPNLFAAQYGGSSDWWMADTETSHPANEDRVILPSYFFAPLLTGPFLLPAWDDIEFDLRVIGWGDTWGQHEFPGIVTNWTCLVGKNETLGIDWYLTRVSIWLGAGADDGGLFIPPYEFTTDPPFVLGGPQGVLPTVSVSIQFIGVHTGTHNVYWQGAGGGLKCAVNITWPAWGPFIIDPINSDWHMTNCKAISPTGLDWSTSGPGNLDIAVGRPYVNECTVMDSGMHMDTDNDMRDWTGTRNWPRYSVFGALA